MHCALLDHSKHPEDRPSFQSKETRMIIFNGTLPLTAALPKRTQYKDNIEKRADSAKK